MVLTTWILDVTNYYMDKDFSVIEEMLGIVAQSELPFDERTDEREALSREDMATYLRLVYNTACGLYVSGEYQKAKEQIDSVIRVTGIDDFDNKEFPFEYYDILVKLERLMALCLLKLGLYDDASNFSSGAAMNIHRYDFDNMHERAKSTYISGIAFFYLGRKNKALLEGAKRMLEEETEMIQDLIKDIDSYLSKLQ